MESTLFWTVVQVHCQPRGLWQEVRLSQFLLCFQTIIYVCPSLMVFALIKPIDQYFLLKYMSFKYIFKQDCICLCIYVCMGMIYTCSILYWWNKILRDNCFLVKETQQLILILGAHHTVISQAADILEEPVIMYKTTHLIRGI